MNSLTSEGRIFPAKELALAYAWCAERTFGGSVEDLRHHPAVTPVFVTLLFQSMEISIKHTGIASGIISEADSRKRSVRNGHGIEELATLICSRFRSKSIIPLARALTFRNKNPHSLDIVLKMICGSEFANTRDSFASRRLGYGEIREGDFALVEDIAAWAETVKQTALNLDYAVNIVRQWTRHKKDSTVNFAIWY